MNENANYSLGIDIGSTTVKIAMNDPRMCVPRQTKGGGLA